MFDNPFTPVFGGKPEFFFGRHDVLTRFDRAMVDRGSEDRALFITGARGNGKTALLEQLSQHARAKGRKVVDLSSENTVEILVRNIMKHDEETRTISPAASLNVFGTGASVSAGSISKKTHYTTADLQMVFLDACERFRSGLLVTIDEVQKVPEPDLTAICDAFQMASRKGYDVMIAVAGLPFAHSQVIQYQGCTYLRRAAHEEIGLFSRSEAEEAFSAAFTRVKGLKISDAALADLVGASFGHPYLMQLLGYYLVLNCNERKVSKGYLISSEDIANIVPAATESYERRALAPMVDELNESERAYLKAMAEAIGDKPIVKSAAVAEALNKKLGEVGKTRGELINLGIIAVPEYGSLMFVIPLLRQYLKKEPQRNRNVARALDWGV